MNDQIKAWVERAIRDAKPQEWFRFLGPHAEAQARSHLDAYAEDEMFRTEADVRKALCQFGDDSLRQIGRPNFRCTLPAPLATDTREALERAVNGSPKDRGSRAAYAKYLEENGLADAATLSTLRLEERTGPGGELPLRPVQVRLPAGYHGAVSLEWFEGSVGDQLDCWWFIVPAGDQ